MSQSIVVRTRSRYQESLQKHVTRIVEKLLIEVSTRCDLSRRNAARVLWTSLEALNSGISYTMQLRRTALVQTMEEARPGRWGERMR
jgi:hypothetical protein